MRRKKKSVVTASQFETGVARYLAQAKRGKGPIHITEDDELVAVVLSPEDAEALAIRDLLKTRMSGPTISHEEVEAKIAQRRKRILSQS